MNDGGQTTDNDISLNGDTFRQKGKEGKHILPSQAHNDREFKT